ncbi:hypothetical protein PGTUg99_008708 [Puccinia graminis f. sp. tritici]|uniref:Uncharacterized protein n=1 Tax=Puccinia graminis f. sp. tritici TaxID=56615 RepID=A0A5B0QG51_PUCGR|nr:hypothetical protein PGTUg99_008708 [Puccinia graminis f. sp. tritici]
MVLAQVSPRTSKYSASMFFASGLVHLLCLSHPIGSASIKLLDSPDHSIDSTREGHVRAVKSAAHISRRSDTGLSPAVANSGCYNYLKEKDGCAYANPTNNCARKMSSMAVQLFAMGPPPGNTSSHIDQSSLPSEKALLKRNENQTWSAPTPKNTTSFLATNSILSSNSSSNSSVFLGNTSLPLYNNSESSICGNYDGEEQMGVCLWSGPSSGTPDSNGSGWVSSNITGNCHKEVILQRSGSNSPMIVARVLEGCSFSTEELSTGCSQIYITKKVFMALNPSPTELEKGALEDTITWDFNSRGNIFNSAV